MLAIIAAILFALAAILDWSNAKVSDPFGWQSLVALGLMFVALHLVYPWAPWTRRAGPPA